jgi:hypothetical protein
MSQCTTGASYIAPLPFNFTHLQSAFQAIDWPFFLCHLHSASPSRATRRKQRLMITAIVEVLLPRKSPSHPSKFLDISILNTAETSRFVNIIESTERRTHIRIHAQQLNKRLHNGAYITTDRQFPMQCEFDIHLMPKTLYYEEVF